MNKALKLTVLLLFTSTITMMAQNNLHEIWPGKVPGETKAKAAPVFSPESTDGVTRITEVTNPGYVKIVPTVASNKEAVVVCPGGAYSILSWVKEGTDIGEWLAGQGFTAYVLQYRVPGKKEGALQDAQRIIRLVRADKFAKVGIMGFSAGASLSERASTRFTENLYDAVDKADSLSCRPDFTLLIYPAYMDEGANKTLTPELTVTSNTPPTFIFQTADDPYGNSALVIAGALRNQKVPVELHFLPQGGHGYGLRKDMRAGVEWPKLAEQWLKNHKN